MPAATAGLVIGASRGVLFFFVLSIGAAQPVAALSLLGGGLLLGGRLLGGGLLLCRRLLGGGLLSRRLLGRRLLGGGLLGLRASRHGCSSIVWSHGCPTYRINRTNGSDHNATSLTGVFFLMAFLTGAAFLAVFLAGVFFLGAICHNTSSITDDNPVSQGLSVCIWSHDSIEAEIQQDRAHVSAQYGRMARHTFCVVRNRRPNAFDWR